MDLIIIVGLPCSGKTYLSNFYKEEFKIYDDFLQNYYNQELKNDFFNNTKLCI